MLADKNIFGNILRKFSICISFPVSISSFSPIFRDFEVISQIPWYLDYLSLTIGIIMLLIYEGGGMPKSISLIFISSALLSQITFFAYYGLAWNKIEQNNTIILLLAFFILVFGFISVYKLKNTD